jgi:hypothetical protein
VIPTDLLKVDYGELERRMLEGNPGLMDYYLKGLEK